MSRYKNLVYAKSKPYFLAGADDDDIIQEGLIGLYKAVMDLTATDFRSLKSLQEYDVNKAHYKLPLKRRRRKKHLPLNSYVSLDKNNL